MLKVGWVILGPWPWPFLKDISEMVCWPHGEHCCIYIVFIDTLSCEHIAWHHGCHSGKVTTMINHMSSISSPPDQTKSTWIEVIKVVLRYLTHLRYPFPIKYKIVICKYSWNLHSNFMNNRKIYFEGWHGAPLDLISYADLFHRRGPAGVPRIGLFLLCCWPYC